MKSAKSYAFDYAAARPALARAGIKPEDIEHMMDCGSELAGKLAAYMDAAVLEMVSHGRCVHPESLCIALALLFEKGLSMRLADAGEKMLDTIKCIEAARECVLVEVTDSSGDEEGEEDEGDGEVRTSQPTTIH
jgi:hypothetical protein